MYSKYERRALIGAILFCGIFWTTVILIALK